MSTHIIHWIHWVHRVHSILIEIIEIIVIVEILSLSLKFISWGLIILPFISRSFISWEFFHWIVWIEILLTVEFVERCKSTSLIVIVEFVLEFIEIILFPLVVEIWVLEVEVLSILEVLLERWIVTIEVYSWVILFNHRFWDQIFFFWVHHLLVGKVIFIDDGSDVHILVHIIWKRQRIVIALWDY